MRHLLIILTVTIAAALISSAASAQLYIDPWSKKSSLDVRVGVAFLSGDTEDDTTYIVGIQHQSKLGDPVTSDQFLTFGVDWIPISTLTEGTVDTIPALIGYKKYGVVWSTRAYTHIAAGVRWSSDEITELEIEDGFNFAWSIAIGIEPYTDLFGQLRFIGGENPGDDGVFTIEFGTRF